MVVKKNAGVTDYLRSIDLEKYQTRVLSRMNYKGMTLEEALKDIDIDQRKLAKGKYAHQKYFVVYNGVKTPIANALSQVLIKYNVPYKLINCEVLFYQRIKNHNETPEQALQHIENLYENKYGVKQ